MLKRLMRNQITFSVFMTLSLIGAAQAANVAIIDTDTITPSAGERRCDMLVEGGHDCIVFPSSGPTSALDPFDVVIDMSNDWADPDGMLADHMRAGKSVILWGGAPLRLGIDTNPTVQAWIGANVYTNGTFDIVIVDTDPILGDIVVGTHIGFCGLSDCTALYDTTGHPQAKILAEFEFDPFIGILRNYWEGGRSVYFSGDGITNEILLRTVNILTGSIPTVSQWGLSIITLLILISGTVIIRMTNNNGSISPNRLQMCTGSLTC